MLLRCRLGSSGFGGQRLFLVGAGDEPALCQNVISHLCCGRHLQRGLRGRDGLVLRVHCVCDCAAANLRCLRLCALGLCGFLPQLGHGHLHLQFLRCSLRLCSLLLFRRRLFRVRITHACHRTDAVDQLVPVVEVHAFDNQVQHDHDNGGRHRCQLTHQRHQLVSLRLPDRCTPVGIRDQKISLGADDVVLGQAIVDVDVLRHTAHVRDPELFPVMHELLDQADLFLATELLRKTEMVEEALRGQRALLLPALNGNAAACVRLPAQQFIGHAGRLLDHRDGARHHFQMPLAQVAVGVDVEPVPFLNLDQAVRPCQLLGELVQILYSPPIHDDFVGAQDVQGLRRALVHVILDIAQAPDQPVGQVIPVAAIAPERREWVAIVPVRRRAGVDQASVRHDGHMHAG